MRRLPRIALTSGEPAGVGPDLCLALATAQLGAAQPPLELPPCELVCLADERLLAERARRLRLDLVWQRYAPAAAQAGRAAAAAGRFQIIDVPLAVTSEPGRL
ncbi:MAG: hypothetical protein ACRETB_11740, partial [Steroidobacteraceae bacterium]